MAVNNEVNITLKATDKASSKFKSLEKNAGGLWSKLKKLGGPLKAIGVWLWAVGVATWVAGVKLFNMAESLETTIWKAHTVFGEYFDDMDKMASETAKAMGLTRGEFLKASAGIQDLLIPMWFTREEATKNTQELMSLSGALAEWSAGQYDATQVWDILAKAMLWEREQLKSLWIAISENDVQQRLLENWTKDLTGAALQQAKAIATQQLIFEKSTDAQKAYEEGAESLTRKKAELKATLWNLQETIATALLPAFHEIVTTLQPVIEKVAESISLWFKNKENVEKLTNVIKWIISVFQFLFQVLGTLISALYKLGEALWFIAFKVVEFVWTAKQKFIDFKDATLETFANIKEYVVWIFEDMKNAIIEKFQSAIDFVNEALAKVKAVWEKVTAVVNSVKNAASSVASGVSDFVSGAKADGGPVKAWSSYIVWERGSELFVPKTDGTIIPNGGFGWSININMGGVTVTNEADENRLAQKIKAELTESLQMYKFGIS